MKLSFNYDGKKIAYNLTYKKRPSISIQVEADGTVNVIAPVGATVFSVMDKVKGNGAWIVKEIERTQKKEEELSKYMYLGKNYGVEVIDNQEQEDVSVKLVRGKFVVEGKELSNPKIKKAMYEWYAKKATTKIKERMKTFGDEFERLPKKINVELLKGSLYKIEEDVIVLDVNCAVGAITVLDYMLVGALCKFEGLTQEATNAKIGQLVPEYEVAENWLKEGATKYLFS